MDNEINYNTYINLIKCMTIYRKYKMKDAELPHDKFNSQMQSVQYIKFACVDGKKNRNVYVYLFHKDSKYTITSAEMNKLILKELSDPDKYGSLVIFVTAAFSLQRIK